MQPNGCCTSLYLFQKWTTKRRKKKKKNREITEIMRSPSLSETAAEKKPIFPFAKKEENVCTTSSPWQGSPFLVPTPPLLGVYIISTFEKERNITTSRKKKKETKPAPKRKKPFLNHQQYQCFYHGRRDQIR